MSLKSVGPLIINFFTPAATANFFVLVLVMSALNKNKIVYKKIILEKFGSFKRSYYNAKTIYKRILIKNSRFIIANAYKLNLVL